MTRPASPAIGTVLISTALVAVTACSVRGTDIRAVEPTPPAAFEGATTSGVLGSGAEA